METRVFLFFGIGYGIEENNLYEEILMDYALTLRMQKPLEEYLEYMERLSTASLYLLEGCMDMFCMFQDPVHKVRGKDSVSKIWMARLECLPAAKFKIDDFSWGRKPACAYAHFMLGDVGEGMIEIEFNEDGRVVSHREFWSGAFPYGGRKYQKALI